MCYAIRVRRKPSRAYSSVAIVIKVIVLCGTAAEDHTHLGQNAVLRDVSVPQLKGTGAERRDRQYNTLFTPKSFIISFLSTLNLNLKQSYADIFIINQLKILSMII